MPPAPVQTVPILLATDTVEVTVFSSEAGPTLVGAIELVSPANKDRLTQSRTFVSRCETYLQQGIGLVIVDVVTVRKANLHNELLRRLAVPASSYLQADLYAVAYRVVARHGQHSVDIWQETLAFGRALPTMPLWLRGAICLATELDTTYERTCREQRIIGNGAKPGATARPAMHCEFKLSITTCLGRGSESLMTWPRAGRGWWRHSNAAGIWPLLLRWVARGVVCAALPSCRPVS